MHSSLWPLPVQITFLRHRIRLMLRQLLKWRTPKTHKQRLVSASWSPATYPSVFHPKSISTKRFGSRRWGSFKCPVPHQGQPDQQGAQIRCRYSSPCSSWDCCTWCGELSRHSVEDLSQNYRLHPNHLLPALRQQADTGIKDAFRDRPPLK